MNSKEPREYIDEAARSILAALRNQTRDLRALTFGLAGVLLLIWIFDAFAFTNAFVPPCCGFGRLALLDFGGAGAFPVLIATGLLLSNLGIWTARSRESRELREEWRALLLDAAAPVSVHFVERTGVWRDAIRRNNEAAIVSGVLMSLAIVWLALSGEFEFARWSPLLTGTYALGLIVGCGSFAGLQIGAIAISGRATQRAIDRGRIHALESFGNPDGSRSGPEPMSTADEVGPREVEERVTSAENAVRDRERDALRSAISEFRFGSVVLLGAAIGLTAMALVSVAAIVSPAPPTYYSSGSTWGNEVGVGLALVGFTAVVWAGAPLLRPITWPDATGDESAEGAPPQVTLVSIDRAVGQLDLAHATARRCRNAVLIASVLIFSRFWFFPFEIVIRGGDAALIGLLLTQLALPLALVVAVWTAYRSDRIEGLQLELRQWVGTLARLEKAFWDKF